MKNLKEIQTQNRMIRDLILFIFLPGNAGIIASVLSFKDSSTLLKNQSDNVSDLFAQYVKILKGIARKRRRGRLDLARESFIIMQAARAWFILQGNLDAAGQLNIALSILERTPYAKLSQKIASAQNLIAPQVPHLALYNITPESFAAWQDQLTAYNNLQSARSGITDRKTYGDLIMAAMKDTMQTLKTQCDTTVHSIRNQNFVINYFNKRRLVQEGVHHTGARVQLVNEMGEPFGPQISVSVDSFTKKERTYKAVSALTNDTGAADVSIFEPGERFITVSGPGIITKTFGPYIFHKSKILQLTLTCQPQFENVPPSQEQAQNQPANNQ